MSSEKPLSRSDYKKFVPITTRWMDNDIYGHVNNVTYYSYFDSAVNRHLIEEGGLDIHDAPIVGFVVNSHCNYLAPIAYPDAIEVGLRVNKLGNSSVATVPTLYDLILNNQIENHEIKPGDIIILASVGAGMNINAIVYKQ